MKDVINIKFVQDHQEEILKIEDIIPSRIFECISDEKIKEYFEYNKQNSEFFAKEFKSVEEWVTSEETVLDEDFPEDIINLLVDWVDCYPQFEKVLNREYFDEFIENDGVLDQSDELNEIEKRFHKVIMHRVGYLIEKFKIELPHINQELSVKTDFFSQESFPVPGMYGGFYYFLTIENGDYVLYSDSWSRIAGGSGQTHRITAFDCELIDEGFV